MGLTGISVDNPRPAIRREYVFSAGPSTGTAPDRPVLLVGNKTSSGTETVDVLGDPIVDDADCRTRFGLRSELYAMYRRLTEHPQDGTIYGICPTESVGVAASVPLTVANASTASSSWKITICGEDIWYSAENGDTIQATSDGIAAAINDYDGGRLQVTAVSAMVGAGPTWAATVTAAQKGPRGDLIIGATANRGIRVTAVGTNAQTVTKTTGSYIPGTTEDDHTAALAEIANGEYYYQVTAKTATTTVTATDNGLGEHATMILTQSLPINGKDQRLFYGTVGTSSQSVAVAISSAMNSVYCHQVQAENCDWTPAMLAAHVCGLVRQQEIVHPGANCNQWTTDSTRGRIFNVPKPYLKADYPTNAEIVTQLNNGVCPISYVGGRVMLERFITTCSLNSVGNNDYRTREGHIPSTHHFFWALAAQLYQSIRQPFADDDPAEGQLPTAKTMTPSTIRAMLSSLIDDLCSSAPQRGKYAGPILKPSARDKMKAAIDVKYAGGGSFPTSVDLEAVEHDIKWEVILRGTGGAY